MGLILDSTVFIDAERGGRTVIATLDRGSSGGSMHSPERGTTIPTADLWIGATALELGFGIATGNPRHFRLIPGLRTHIVR